MENAFSKYKKQVEQYSKLNKKKPINSHQKQINSHKSKIENPQSHVPDWNQLPKRHQENILLNWEKDIGRHQSYSKIAEGILEKSLKEAPKNGR